MPKNPRSYEKTRHIALSGLLFALAMALSFIEGSLVIPGLLPGMKLGLANIVGLGATGTGVTGIFGILLHLHMPLQYIIMMAISFGVSFAVTWVIWSPEEVKA